MKTKNRIFTIALVLGMMNMFAFSLAHADTTSVQAQLQALMQELSQLQNQANGTITATPSANPTTVSSYAFTATMTVGSQGTEVSALQQILINNGYLTAITTPSGYFGQATKAALVQYQIANSISPATGYFGSLTMANFNAKNNADINQSLSSGTSVNPPSPIVVPTPVVQAQPTASIEANGTKGAIMIPYGSPVTLTWSSSNANSCNISPVEFSGTSGDQTTAALTTSQIYSLTCTSGDESTAASVTVDVAAPPQNNASPTPSQSYQQSSQTSPAATSNETVSQQNAVREAQSYLSYTAFSYDGLIAQLEYEQFSSADATYGADNSGADWNAEAAKAAQQYMSYSAFSQGSLIAQLEYDKFTPAQAEYGASAVGL